MGVHGITWRFAVWSGAQLIYTTLCMWLCQLVNSIQLCCWAGSELYQKDMSPSVQLLPNQTNLCIHTIWCRVHTSDLHWILKQLWGWCYYSWLSVYCRLETGLYCWLLSGSCTGYIILNTWYLPDNAVNYNVKQMACFKQRRNRPTRETHIRHTYKPIVVYRGKK